MLRKLMKHEFRATGRMMLPMFLLVLVTAVGANLSTRRLLETDNGALNTLGMLLLIAFTLAITGVCIMPLVLMIDRFHKNLLRDEGYVMMTLPVSVHQHVWSKLLVSMIWFVATGVVVFLAFVILAYEVGLAQQFFTGLAELLRQVRVGDYYLELGSVVGIGVEVLVLLALSCAGGCLQIYAAMAIGHSFANRKVIWSVVVFFGSQFALQLLGGLLVTLMEATGLDAALTQALPKIDSQVGATMLLLFVLIVCALIFAAVFYFLTTYFLKKRLNLE